MIESSLEFQFSGPEAREAADEMAVFLRRSFQEGSVWIVPHHASEGQNATRCAGDLLVGIAVLLSLPGAVLSGLELAERFRLVPRLRALIEWARARRESGQSVPWLRIPLAGQPGAVRTCLLDELEVEQLIEMLAADVAAASPPAKESGERTAEH